MFLGALYTISRCIRFPSVRGPAGEHHVCSISIISQYYYYTVLVFKLRLVIIIIIACFFFLHVIAVDTLFRPPRNEPACSIVLFMPCTVPIHTAVLQRSTSSLLLLFLFLLFFFSSDFHLSSRAFRLVLANSRCVRIGGLRERDRFDSAYYIRYDAINAAAHKRAALHRTCTHNART